MSSAQNHGTCFDGLDDSLAPYFRQSATVECALMTNIADRSEQEYVESGGKARNIMGSFNLNYSNNAV